MAITIKLANGTQHTIEVSDFSITISDLKKQLAEALGIPADEQRIIFKGKVLKDENILSAVGMEDGIVIHVVRSKKNSASATESTQSANSNPPNQVQTATAATPVASPSQSAVSTNPYAALMNNFGALGMQPNPTGTAGFPMGGMPFGNMGGAGNPTSAQAMELMQNPMMQQMMQQALSNPQFMQYFIQSSPQLAAMPPEQQQATIELMQNPFVMQQAMSMMGTLGNAGGAQPGLSQPASSSATGAAAYPPFFAPPQPQGNPRELYREQLQQLRDMGFPNEDANIAALQQAQGNIQFALERLLGA